MGLLSTIDYYHLVLTIIDKSFAVLAKGILLDEGISSKYLFELLIEDTKGGIDWNPNPLPKMTYFRNSL